MHDKLRRGVGGKASFVRSTDGVLAADRTPGNISTHTQFKNVSVSSQTALWRPTGPPIIYLGIRSNKIVTNVSKHALNKTVII